MEIIIKQHIIYFKNIVNITDNSSVYVNSEVVKNSYGNGKSGKVMYSFF